MFSRAKSQSDSDSEKAATKAQPRSNQGWWTRKRLLIIGGVIFVVIALAVGLGVGLGIGLHRGNGNDDDNNDNNGGNGGSNTIPIPPASSPTANPTNVWRPAVGDSWDYQLGAKLASTATNNITVWGIDLFDNNQTMIQGLQANGAKVICYFSAGSYEDWRSDASSFQSSDLGKDLNGWQGERWLNTNSQNVRNIMITRLNLAQQKGCDGVDPDNVDGYSNENGVGLTEEAATNYMLFLAQAAQQRNLSIGLKNAQAIISTVLPYMQWSVNEQCVEFDECEEFRPFIDANKPVFHVEYPKGDKDDNNNVSTAQRNKACDNAAAQGFSTIIKNLKLDTWIELC